MPDADGGKRKSAEEEARYSQSKTMMTATKKRNRMEISFFCVPYIRNVRIVGFVKKRLPASRWVTRTE